MSYLYSVVAFSVFIYLETFGGTLATDSLIAFSIIAGGIILQYTGHLYKEDSHISKTEGRSIFYYTVFALAIFFILNAIVPSIPLREIPLAVTVGTIPFVAFGVLIGFAEEQFFRGFFFNFLLIKTRIPFSYAAVIDGVFFGIYHGAVYGGSLNSILIVMGAGVVLCYVAFKTSRISTSMSAHALNNGISFSATLVVPHVIAFMPYLLHH